MKRTSQVGQGAPNKRLPPIAYDALRGWIDRVIVPILLDQYLHKKALPEEEGDG